MSDEEDKSCWAAGVNEEFTCGGSGDITYIGSKTVYVEATQTNQDGSSGVVVMKLEHGDKLYSKDFKVVVL